MFYHEYKLLCVYFGRSVQSNQRPRSLPFQWFRARKVASWNGLNDSGKLPSRVDVRTLPCSITNSVCFAMYTLHSANMTLDPGVAYCASRGRHGCHPFDCCALRPRVVGKESVGGTSLIEKTALAPQAGEYRPARTEMGCAATTGAVG